MQQVELFKPPHRFIVRWEYGDELPACAAINDWTKNPELPFDWFDTAVMDRSVWQKLEIPCNSPKPTSS
jgi:hypothetical protein